jgi:3-oxoacyl-(acyl-carrier-protein) synthase/acyl carrier protein/NAD(P)-dependent dehydrogenase (short-subunit alcohol dehydrogenase family)
VQTFKLTSTGKHLPDRWVLPEALRDDTGVIFASAFPGGDRFADEFTRYHTWQSRKQQLEMLEDLRNYTTDSVTLSELNRRIGDLRDDLEREPYFFDRRFLFRILAMGHSQFAQYIGARGPNTHVNAACASTAQGIAIAEDWIRTGRCRRVIVVGADDVTGDSLMDWVGAGFLAVGAVTTKDQVTEAALPFDRRRHGTILGMGACALVVESEDSVRERGMRGIVELLSSETSNSAYHGTRLDVEHIGMIMDSLVTAAERRFGLNRHALAPQTVFMSHETFTPARGGSASAEIIALRRTFGESANSIIMANTKGFTGHPMGVGVEDVIAVKILEYGIVPPVPNFKEVDPELGPLNLSRGGRYPVQYAIHLAAGFGSQISMTFTRRIPGNLERIDNKPLYQRWLAEISGYDTAETEVVKRVLRVSSNGKPPRPPMPNRWQVGTGPTLRALAGGEVGSVDFPARMIIPTPANGQPPATPLVEKVPAPDVAKVERPPVPVAVEPAPAPVAPIAEQPAQPAMPIAIGTMPAAVELAVDPVVKQVLAIVAAQTGYPSEMLDMDLDLEADLGIDTVKQAETFAAIREAFDIPRRDDLRLRDYPTLVAVVGFVKEMRPDLAQVTMDHGLQTIAAETIVPRPSSVVTEPSSAADQVAGKVLAIVAGQTGYPVEMLDLDLDLEADLGIDTVKQAETFAAIREAFDIPRRDDLRLRDYPTLGAVIGFVKEMRPDLAQVTMDHGPQAVAAETIVPRPSSVGTESSSAADQVAGKVLAIVAGQTGYPVEMLDLDLDLEADLGIDTVKQAETFMAIRQAFDIPRRDDLRLRDYPTLAAVIGFVRDNRPDLAQTTMDNRPQATSEINMDHGPQTKAAETIVRRPSPIVDVSSSGVDPVTYQVLEIVAGQTGYPKDMLELDLDLEADLGIDTVKQAETFMAIRQAFDIPRRDDLKLRDYPTLAAVIGFVRDNRPDLAQTTMDNRPQTTSEMTMDHGPQTKAAETIVRRPSSIADVSSSGVDPVTDQVLEIVAGQTGYPKDMLELDLDLEADLGIDTVKQAETFMAIRQAFDIPRRDDLKLRDYPTLAAVIGFVRDNRPDLAAIPTTHPGPQIAAEETVVHRPSSVVQSAQAYNLADADTMPRRVPVPSLRPALELCKPTGVSLGQQSRIVVMHDRGGVGKALATRLEKMGATILAFEEAPTTEALEAQLQAWLSEGSIQGVYWLPALDIEPNLEEMDLETWHELNRIRVKNLYTTMRTLYQAVSGPGTFLVSATRLGGLFGYGPDGATAPLGGGVAGFTKAYKRERGDSLVKVIDFETGRKTAGPADALVAETLTDPGVVEIGYWNDNRYAITLVEEPAADGGQGLTLDQNTVFLVTGAAGGITSAIIGDLAAASGGTFYLLDLVAEPARDDQQIALFRAGKEALKQHLIDEAKGRGEKVTPAQIDKQIMAVERTEAALRAIESVEAAGGKAFYRSVNLLDSPALTAVVDEIREQYGRIDVLVHAGGIEISRTLPDKDFNQFSLVYDIKSDGFFSLLKAAKGMPIGATVSFSSVAGRFGNNGQTDYSAANDLLCKITSSLRQWRPETKGIVIDWTAWGDIGMATRGSIPRIMEMAGIDMLPPAAGVPTVRRELVAGSFKGEIVVGGRLGILVEEWDETGGLDLEKANTWLAGLQPPPLMLGRIKAARLYGGLAVETTLDPNVQPFLYDHAMDGTPLLPGVMGTESFGQIAKALAPSYQVAAVFDEQFHAPFKFYRMEPQTLHLNAIAIPLGEGNLIAHTTLQSVRDLGKPGLPPQEKLHFTGKVLLAREIDPVEVEFSPPASEALPITAADVYRIYFHGPAYQVIERVDVQANTAIGLMAANLPPNTNPERTASVIAPRLVELCFQTAGVWDIKTTGTMALPLAVGSVTAYRQPEEANGQRLYALVEAIDGGDTYNATVVDETGNVYVELKGYRTVDLPGQVTL